METIMEVNYWIVPRSNNFYRVTFHNVVVATNDLSALIRISTLQDIYFREVKFHSFIWAQLLKDIRTLKLNKYTAVLGK